MPKKNHTLCTCLECWKVFYVPNSWIKKGRGKYCSRACAGQGKSKKYKGREGYWKGKTFTKEHKEKISKANKGRHIGNKFGLNGRSRTGMTNSKEHKRKCSLALKGRVKSIEEREKLSKALMGHPGLKGKDNPMYGIHLPGYWKGKKMPEHSILRGEKHPQWRGGKSFEPYGFIYWTETLKKAIRQRDNYTCQICDKKQKRPRLHIHHKDYNKQNSDPDNLISLCAICHAKTNYNRKLWEKFFESDAEFKILSGS